MDAKLNYIVKKAFEDIRAGVKLDERLIAELHEKSAMDLLRLERTSEDLDRLIKLAKSGTEPEHKLAVGILAYSKNDPPEFKEKISVLLFNLWESNRKEHNVRICINLIVRLLDYDNLLEQHHIYYEYIVDNWDIFIETQIGYMGEGRSDIGKGDPKKVLLNVEKRMGDFDKFPSTKHWVYLCSAMASDDYPGIIRLLDNYKVKLDSGLANADLTKKVIEDNRERTLEVLRKIDTFPPEESWREHDALIWGLVHKKTDQKVSYLCSSQCSVQNNHLNNSKSSSKFNRIFLKLLREFNGNNPNYTNLMQESIAEWKWHAGFVLELAKLGTDNKCLLNYRTNSDRWAKRFSFLYLFAERISLQNLSGNWSFGSFSDPLLINYPIPCRAITSENMVFNLPQIMDASAGGGAAENFTIDLVKNMRVIQWEVMPRDLFVEYTDREIFQIPKVEAYTGSVGLLRKDEFSDLVKSSWDEAVREKRLLSRSGEDKETDTFNNSIKKAVNYIEQLPDQFRSDIKATPKTFDAKTVHRYSSFVKYISEYVNIQKKAGSESGNTETESQLIVAADGELTFFSILLHFRKAEREELSELFFRLGLLCPVDHNFWVTTERFESFANWFFRIHTKLVRLRESVGNKEIDRELFAEYFVPMLPVRHNVDVASNLMFLVKLYSLLSSQILFNGILKTLVTQKFKSPETFHDCIFKESLKEQEFGHQSIANIFLPAKYNDYLTWALSKNGELDKTGADEYLITTSRTCYFPLEESLRSYQPYPLSLLIMPFDFGFPSREGEKLANLAAGIDEDLAVPSAICFASVYGVLDYDKDEIYRQDCGADGTTCNDKNLSNLNGERYSPTNVTKEWLNMYWSVFQSISSAISIRAYEKMSLELTSHFIWRNERGRQGHEFKRVINCIYHYAPKPILDLVRGYFYGVVLDAELLSVELAKVHDDKEDYRLPSDFINNYEESFDAFLIRLSNYAAKIRLLIKLGKDTSKDRFEKYKTCHGEAQLAADSSPYALKLNIDESLSNKVLVAGTDEKLTEERTIYSAMITALLINICMNSNPECEVAVTYENNYLIFINVPDEENIGKLDRLASSPEKKEIKFGGTESSLDSYLARLENYDPEWGYKSKLEYNKEEGLFYTKIAAPVLALWKTKRGADEL